MIDLENKLIPREKRLYGVSFKVKPEEKGLGMEVMKFPCLGSKAMHHNRT